MARLIDILTEPSPATFVGTVLKLYRQRGYDFEVAWSQAMRSLPRSLDGVQWWRAQFHRDKERWRAAYLEQVDQYDDQRHDAAYGAQSG